MMVEVLYKYYCQNLTYNSCILKLIPWYIRHPIFLCLYFGCVLAILVMILPILPIIEVFVYSVFPILLNKLSALLLLIMAFLMVMSLLLLNYYVKKAIKTNDKLSFIFDYEKKSWSRQKFRLYLLQNLEKYLIDEKIQFKELDKVIEVLKYQIDKERRIWTSAFVTFGILIIPVWEKIVDNIWCWCICMGMSESWSLIVLVFLITVLAFILRRKLEYILNDFYKIRFVGLGDLRDLLLELQIKDYNFPKV